MKSIFHSWSNVIDAYYFEMCLQHGILLTHVSFFYYSTLEPTRWIGKTREQLTEIWFCDQWIVERMSPTSDWNTYQHFERSKYEVENFFLLNFQWQICIYSLSSFPLSLFFLHFIILSSCGQEAFVGTGRIIPFTKDWNKTIIYFPR